VTDPDGKLPEQFAPRGPKLSRFPIQPAPPIRPRLFPDELRFAVRLAILAGAGELAAWAAIGRALVERREPPRAALLLAAAGAAAVHALGPLWDWVGARVSRPFVAGLLLLAALGVDGAWLGLPERLSGIPLQVVLLALALPALGDLAGTAAADAITIERRAAAQSAIEMGRGIGVALGLAAGASSPRALFHVLPPLALVVAAAMLADLRDRGTPRSTWPLSVRFAAAKSVGTALLLAVVIGFFSAAALALSAGTTLAGKALPLGGATIWLLAPLAGMAVFAQIDSRVPDRALALRLAAALAVAAFVSAPEGPEGLGGTLALLALGGAAAALPATIIREAAEMERAPASSAAWIALTVGAGAGALLAIAAAA
jgi:hypothetical protein